MIVSRAVGADPQVVELLAARKVRTEIIPIDGELFCASDFRLAATPTASRWPNVWSSWPLLRKVGPRRWESRFIKRDRNGRVPAPGSRPRWRNEARTRLPVWGHLVWDRLQPIGFRLLQRDLEDAFKDCA